MKGAGCTIGRFSSNFYLAFTPFYTLFAKLPIVAARTAILTAEEETPIGWELRRKCPLPIGYSRLMRHFAPAEGSCRRVCR